MSLIDLFREVEIFPEELPGPAGGLFSSLKVCHGSDETAEGLRLIPLFSAIIPEDFWS